MFLIALIFSAFPDCLSQTLRYDVVRLNNGTFLRGEISELTQDSLLKIVLDSRDTVIIRMSEVTMITKETVNSSGRNNFEHGVKSWGYTFIGEIGGGCGLLEGIDRYKDEPEGQYSVMFSAFNGVTISPYIQLGAGVGFDVWRDRFFLPIYFDFRSYLIKNQNSPFFYVQVGYSFGWYHEQTERADGAIAALGAGARLRLGKSQEFILSLGYRFQQTQVSQTLNQVTTNATIDGHFIVFRMGIGF